MVALLEENVAELPLEPVGVRLRQAREARGLSRADVSQLTRINERHLSLIEDGNFAALPSRTYATGFSRSYAKAVGLDDQVIVQSVREALDGSDIRTIPRAQGSFEPGDPARIPTARFAWLAALAALVLIVGGLVFWRNYYMPAAALPALEDPLATAGPGEPVPGAPATADEAAASAASAVTLTATADRVWIKITDGAGQQLFQKELARGESYTLPGGTATALLQTARPDALAIAIGGKPAAPLADRQMALKDVPITAAALLARGAAPVMVPATGTATAPAMSPAGTTAMSPAGTGPNPAPRAQPRAQPRTVRTQPPVAARPVARASLPAPVNLLPTTALPPPAPADPLPAAT